MSDAYDSFADLSPRFIQRLLRPALQKPRTLELPDFNPADISESVEELSARTQTLLDGLLDLHIGIATCGGDIRELVFQFDSSRPAFLESAGKLRSLAPETYMEVCGGYEHVVLQPRASGWRTATTPSQSDRAMVDALANGTFTHPQPVRVSEPKPSAPLRDLVGY